MRLSIFTHYKCVNEKKKKYKKNARNAFVYLPLHSASDAAEYNK